MSYLCTVVQNDKRSLTFCYTISNIVRQVGFAVRFAVEGAADGGDLFVEERHLVQFQALLKEQGKGAFGEGASRSGNDEELEGLSGDGMRRGDAEAVGNQRRGECGVLHLDV